MGPPNKRTGEQEESVDESLLSERGCHERIYDGDIEKELDWTLKTEHGRYDEKIRSNSKEQIWVMIQF